MVSPDGDTQSNCSFHSQENIETTIGTTNKTDTQFHEDENHHQILLVANSIDTTE